jgi:cell wall-associated NlpC family hydrolase
MPASPVRGRRRASGPPRTPLDDVADAAGARAAAAARRVGVAAGTSCLLVSVLSGAAPLGSALQGSGGPAADVPSTSAGRTADVSRPTSTPWLVTVPLGVTWSFDVPVLTVVADPPPPPPPPPPVAKAPAPAPVSRSAARAGPAPVIGVAPPASADGNAVIEIAAGLVGTPYVYGGTTPDGFDCSGFTSYVYAQLGISLPRTSSEQHYAGTIIPRDQALPGDLVWSPGHIAIYAGGSTIIDSPAPGGTVQFRAMYQSDPVFIRIG